MGNPISGGTDAATAAARANHPETYTGRKNSNSLTMDSFMKLLVAQLQNQDMTNPMNDSEFMAQLTQMATVEAMTTFTDISTTTYSASLVGKEVTVAAVDADGKIEEVYGKVTGAALYGGQQVIFIDDKSYYLSQIMAVGKLPPKKEEGEGGDNGEDGAVEGAGDGTDGTYIPPKVK